MTFHRLTPPPIPFATRPQWKPSQSTVDTVITKFTHKNAVYYPNWRVYRGETPATLNYSCISHVFYAFAHVNVDGSVFVSIGIFLKRFLHEYSYFLHSLVMTGLI